MDVPPILTKKLGPLPVVAWAGVGAAAFVVYRLLKGGSSSTTSASPSTALLPAADAGSSGSTDSGTGAPPVVTVPTVPTIPPPTVVASHNGSRISVLQTAIKTLNAEIAHNNKLHTKTSLANAKSEKARLATYSAELASLTKKTPLLSAPTVAATAQVTAVQVPAGVINTNPSGVFSAPSTPISSIAGAVQRPATAASIALAKFPVGTALKPTVQTASA